jgi:hypothetical protein
LENFVKLRFSSYIALEQDLIAFAPGWLKGSIEHHLRYNTHCHFVGVLCPDRQRLTPQRHYLVIDQLSRSGKRPAGDPDLRPKLLAALDKFQYIPIFLEDIAPSGSFSLCDYCRALRDSSFALCHLTSQSSTDVYLLLGLFTGLGIPGLLLVRGEADEGGQLQFEIPSMLQGIDAFYYGRYKEITERLGEEIDGFLKQQKRRKVAIRKLLLPDQARRTPEEHGSVDSATDQAPNVEQIDDRIRDATEERVATGEMEQPQEEEESLTGGAVPFVVPAPEETEYLLQLLKTHRDRLAHYLQQRAELEEGVAPFAVVNAIAETRHELQRIRDELREKGISVEDHSDDEEEVDTQPLSVPPSWSDADTIASQLAILATYRQTLIFYLKQQAAMGRDNLPPSVLNGIREARDSIHQIKTQLRYLGVKVAEHPDDDIELTSGYEIGSRRSQPRLRTAEEIADQMEILANYRRTLAVYLTQQAFLEPRFTPLNTFNGISEARESIYRIKRLLRDAGVAVEDRPEDSDQLTGDSSDSVRETFVPEDAEEADDMLVVSSEVELLTTFAHVHASPYAINELQGGLTELRRTIMLLLRQLAQLGGKVYAPPYLMHNIRESRIKIRQIKARLRSWQIPVEDHLIDEEITGTTAQTKFALPTNEEISELQALLWTYRQTLAAQLEQEMRYGDALAPPSIINSIAESREQVDYLKTILRMWGVEVDDHPNDVRSVFVPQ